MWGGGSPAQAAAPPAPNIITITSKTTAEGYDDVAPVLGATTASITLAAGSHILVAVQSHPSFGAVNTVTFGASSVGDSGSADRTHAGAASRVTVFSQYFAGGGSGVVAVNMTTPVIGQSVLVSVSQMTALATSSWGDQTNSAGGSGTSPTVTAGSPTSQANEIIIGAIGVDNVAGFPNGTWQDSFATINEIAGSDNFGLSVGYRIVSAVGTYTAAKTGITSSGWTDVLTTYKQAP